jgi:dTDP-4-dehydrorhamnose reductase
MKQKHKILVTGANGLLGQKLVYMLKKESQFALIACGRGDNRLLNHENYVYERLDITSEDEILALIDKYKPETIIHAAAMTHVDECELNEQVCKKNNVDATQYIIDALESVQSENYRPHLIYISTDFIFDGSKGPVDETEKPQPLSIYGYSKWSAEKIIRNSKIDHAILRTVLVYGVTEGNTRSNVVLWVKSNLEAGKKINVVNDQYRTPTLAEDLAEACILTTKKRASGIYHISGKDFMNIFQLANRVANYFHLDHTLIHESNSVGINQPAKRPPITGFIIEKAIKELGYRPHSFEEGLRVVSEQLRNNT